MCRDQVPDGGSGPDRRCIWHRLNALCQTHTSAGLGPGRVSRQSLAEGRTVRLYLREVSGSRLLKVSIVVVVEPG